MQMSVVMVMALSGLGCQNKGCDVSPTPQTCYTSSPCALNAYPGSFAPSGYPVYAPSRYGRDNASDYTFHSSVRSTLWSFVLGRDPDVASASEIEATFYSGGYGASAYPGGYGR
jgi:hypothetical protein